jgi:hypothetical protein
VGSGAEIRATKEEAGLLCAHSSKRAKSGRWRSCLSALLISNRISHEVQQRTSVSIFAWDYHCGFLKELGGELPLDLTDVYKTGKICLYLITVFISKLMVAMEGNP